MAETMTDDDMILVIVGDNEVTEGDGDVPKIRLPCPIPIKQEPLDHSGEAPAVNEILKTVAEHGEYIIKQEPEEYIEFLEEEFLNSFEQKEGMLINSTPDVESTSYNPKVFKDDKNCGYNLRENKSKLNSQTNSKQKPERAYKTSYVAQLRKQHPEFRRHPKLLVEHLAGIMRNMKPPDPPLNYCKVYYEDGIKKFKCNTCGTINGTKPFAARHYQEKHGVRYLICYACAADFRRTTNLYKHEKRCLAPDAKIVLQARGRYLGRKGRGRPFLTRHKFQATAPPPPPPPQDKGRYYCSMCPASFRHKQNLVAHENSHAGLRPYVCHACPAAYTSEAALKRHLAGHGGERFICDHCGRGFKLKPLLKSHLNTHLPVRRFACSHCPRRFAQKSALLHHVNHYHLQLPAAYGCPICPKRYARMSHVKEHMKRVHDLTMITRKMFYKSLPTISDLEIKEARVVLNKEIEELVLPPSPLPPLTPEQMEAKSKRKEKTKRKSANPKKVDSQNTYHIIQDDSDNVPSDSQKVFEIVLDKEENQDMMNDFLQYLQSKVEPGKVIKIQTGAFTKVSQPKVEVRPAEGTVARFSEDHTCD